MRASWCESLEAKMREVTQDNAFKDGNNGSKIFIDSGHAKTFEGRKRRKAVCLLQEHQQ